MLSSLRWALCLGVSFAISLSAAEQAAVRITKSLQEKIDDLLAATPAVAHGQVGFKVLSASTGAILAEKNANQRFIPASNTKLYTTALALVRLGVNFQYQTQVRTSAPKWTKNQHTVPDLLLIGSGDPNLSGRTLPYSKDAKPGNSLTVINQLADQIARLGITEINGDVIGSDEHYPWEPYPDGWTINDSTWYYGAPVSSLTLNDNSQLIRFKPSQPGELAHIEIDPPFEHFAILNQVITVPGKKAEIEIRREVGSRELLVWGTIGSAARPATQEFAIDDPALFTAEVLRQALTERGIIVRGEARARHRSLNSVQDPTKAPLNQFPVGGTVLATHQSPPLWQALQVINKVSQNLHAELMLREVGFQFRGIGTVEAGLLAEADFLKDIGISDKMFTFADGSGLARQTLTSPDTTAKLLKYMYNRPERARWIQLMPVGGVDGTLSTRFRGIRQADRIHAKTGSISHVNALSGYIETKNGWLIISAMVNGTTAPAAQVRQFLDHLCAIFLSE